ncbi:MAG: Holliday junction ATP-dependent DNA helicase RuvA [Endomicrobiaceae bacterium]|nr:Holliday junction ATP-dependent DNA helicase RuvA [Endomicrobiaceae bacterium]
MIDYFRGILSSNTLTNAVIEVNGVGYDVAITVSTSNKLPNLGQEVRLYIVESTGMYGGVVSHYGFLSKEEREMFLLIKDEVPGTGAKKTMEYMEKISKSFADFKNAVVTRDVSMLSSIFGFTKKTAEKLIAALKDKISGIVVIDSQKWSAVSGNANVSEAIAGLVALGYKEFQARETVSKITKDNDKLSVESIIKEALKYL